MFTRLVGLVTTKTFVKNVVRKKLEKLRQYLKKHGKKQKNTWKNPARLRKKTGQMITSDSLIWKTKISDILVCAFKKNLVFLDATLN